GGSDQVAFHFFSPAGGLLGKAPSNLRRGAAFPGMLRGRRRSCENVTGGRGAFTCGAGRLNAGLRVSRKDPHLAMTEFSPREIVSELDRHIIGQKDAKRAVAIALRNRWRRRQLQEPLRSEVT